MHIYNLSQVSLPTTRSHATTVESIYKHTNINQKHQVQQQQQQQHTRARARTHIPTLTPTTRIFVIDFIICVLLCYRELIRQGPPR